MNKRGFLLIDSIINVFIVSLMCALCLGIYQAIVTYENGYISYQTNSNERLITIFNMICECEACIIDESD